MSRRVETADAGVLRTSRRVDDAAGLLAAVVIATLLGGLEGSVAALGGAGATMAWGSRRPALAGLGLLACGAAMTLVQGELTASLAYATDRAGAARVTILGVAVLVGIVGASPIRSGSRFDADEVAAPAAATRDAGSASEISATSRARVPLTSAAIVGCAGLAGAVGSTLVGGGRVSDDIAATADLLVAGTSFGEAVATGPGRPDGSFAALALTAHGPISATATAALVLGAGAALLVGSAMTARAQTPSAHDHTRRAIIAGGLVPLGLIAAVAWTGSVADTLAIGLVAIAAAVHQTPGRAGPGAAGLAVGLAALCRPEAILAAMVLGAASLPACPRRPFAALATPALALLVAAPWFAWIAANTTLDAGDIVDARTVLAIMTPLALRWAAAATLRGAS